MKEEAKELGISYEELKKRHKKHRREAESLETDEHLKETKRMRTWSKGDEDDNGPSNNGSKKSEEPRRFHTRSMDAAEERKALQEDASSMDPEEWRKEHQITVQGHGDNRNNEVPKPFFEFDQAPFHESIMRAFKQAGYEKPTAIQSQAWPIGIKRIDMICVAKTGAYLYSYRMVQLVAARIHPMTSNPCFFFFNFAK